MLLALVRALQLRNVTLVVQDWGGLLGLTLPMALPGVVRRLVVMNTALGTGDVPLGKGFTDWRAYSNSQPDMDIAALMRRAVPGLDPADAQAYAAPFPDARYKAGVRRFPNLVPDHPEADGAALSREARQWWARNGTAPASWPSACRTRCSVRPRWRMLRQTIRNCPPPLELAEAGHFVQEQSGDVIAREALAQFDKVGA